MSIPTGMYYLNLYLNSLQVGAGKVKKDDRKSSLPVKLYAVAGGAGAAAFAVFVALAQAHVIFVPYFTPAILQVEGLRDEYGAGEDANFTVSVKGYGSNCHMLQVEALDEQGDRASFYRRADDCRFREITHGQYNLTRAFDYDAGIVLGRGGTYSIDVQFEDLVDGTKASAARTFTVNP